MMDEIIKKTKNKGKKIIYIRQKDDSPRSNSVDVCTRSRSMVKKQKGYAGKAEHLAECIQKWNMKIYVEKTKYMEKCRINVNGKVIKVVTTFKSPMF